MLTSTNGRLANLMLFSIFAKGIATQKILVFYIVDYVILAGGKGSRFAIGGIDVPKPLVPICGEPMIGRLIRILLRKKGRRVIVAVNATMTPVVDYLESLDVDSGRLSILKVSTRNGYETLQIASESVAGRFIAMTCDTIFREDELDDFEKKFLALSQPTLLMGLTRFVDDESPLYAKIEEAGTIQGYRHCPGPYDGDEIISAGVYGLTSQCIRDAQINGVDPISLSDFQNILATSTSYMLYPYVFSTVIDVDRPCDILTAEKFLGCHSRE